MLLPLLPRRTARSSSDLLVGPRLPTDGRIVVPLQAPLAPERLDAPHARVGAVVLRAALSEVSEIHAPVGGEVESVRDHLGRSVGCSELLPDAHADSVGLDPQLGVVHDFRRATGKLDSRLRRALTLHLLQYHISQVNQVARSAFDVQFASEHAPGFVFSVDFVEMPVHVGFFAGGGLARFRVGWVRCHGVGAPGRQVPAVEGTSAGFASVVEGYVAFLRSA